MNIHFGHSGLLHVSLLQICLSVTVPMRTQNVLIEKLVCLITSSSVQLITSRYFFAFRIFFTITHTQLPICNPILYSMSFFLCTYISQKLVECGLIPLCRSNRLVPLANLGWLNFFHTTSAFFDSWCYQCRGTFCRHILSFELPFFVLRKFVISIAE